MGARRASDFKNHTLGSAPLTLLNSGMMWGNVELSKVYQKRLADSAIWLWAMILMHAELAWLAEFPWFPVTTGRNNDREMHNKLA